MRALLAFRRRGESVNDRKRFFPFNPGRAALVIVPVLLMGTVEASAQHQHLLPGASGLPHGIPDFCEVPTVASVRSGPWTDAATWSTGQVPAGGAKVRVAAGHQVSFETVSTVALNCIDVYGSLKFATNVDTRLRVGTMIVMDGGSLEIGSSAQPVSAGVSAELVIANQPIDLSADPDGFGTGLIGIGSVTMHGAPRSPTFVRLAGEPTAGATSLTLSQSVSGWKAGDEVVIPDTRGLVDNERFSSLVSQAERAVIASVSGTRVDLDRPLSYNHRGARNASGAVDYLPHVANVGRNVRIRSENPSGTRGHTLYTNRAAVDIRHVAFEDLGRTTNAALSSSNLIGRYPLHMHHVMGPVNSSNSGYQFRLIGNAVVDSLKWPLTIHNTHYGLIQDNVVAFGDGAGYVTEDGNESYNEFAHNIGIAITGDVNPRDLDGRAGSVFWFHGFNHQLRDNVAASGFNHLQSNVAGIGFDFVWSAASTANTKIPTVRGSDLTASGSYQTVNMQNMKIPRFERNEAYGAMAAGLVIWNLGTDGYVYNAGQPETLIQDFVAWHTWSSGFFGYPINRVTFDGFVARGNPAGLYGHGYWGDDYKMRDVTIRRSDIQGMEMVGIDVGSGSEGTFLIENTVLQNPGMNIRIPRMNTPGTGAEVGPRTVQVNNVRFVTWPGNGLQTLAKTWSGTNQPNPNVSDSSFVYSYQGNASDNFRLYYTAQATQNVAGGLAPCSTTRPGIEGLVCPSTSTPLPPPKAPAAPGTPQMTP